MWITTVWQHSLHRHLVFGTKGNYWKSLGFTYVAYTASIILSSVINDLLAEWLGVNHQVAWITTLFCTGVLNYFTVKNSFASS